MSGQLQVVHFPLHLLIFKVIILVHVITCTNCTLNAYGDLCEICISMARSTYLFQLHLRKLQRHKKSKTQCKLNLYCIRLVPSSDRRYLQHRNSIKHSITFNCRHVCYLTLLLYGHSNLTAVIFVRTYVEYE